MEEILDNLKNEIILKQAILDTFDEKSNFLKRQAFLKLPEHPNHRTATAGFGAAITQAHHIEQSIKDEYCKLRMEIQELQINYTKLYLNLELLE